MNECVAGYEILIRSSKLGERKNPGVGEGNKSDKDTVPLCQKIITKQGWWVHKETNEKTKQDKSNKHETLTSGLWPAELWKKKMQKLNCAQDWDTRLHLLLPETQSSNLTLKCQWKRFRPGLSAERRGLNTDHLSFILKPRHLTELLGFLFPTRQIWPKSMQFSCVYMAQHGGEFWQTSS